MAKLVDYVEELVSEVGPHPTGTQQENDASEIIATRLEDFGLPVQIDEFVCARNTDWTRAVYLALAVVGAELLVFLPSLQIAGFVLLLIGALLLVLELVDRNPLDRLFRNSLSQNVVARYLPDGAASARNRRVVILAHYDSSRAKVQAAPLLVQGYRPIRLGVNITVGALLVLAILVIAPLPDLLDPVLRVLVGVGGGLALVAFLVEIINFFMPYSKGANCNGSGVAVLYGLAQRLVSGLAGADGDEARRTRRSRRSRMESTEHESGESHRGRKKRDSADSARSDGPKVSRISSGTVRERPRGAGAQSTDDTDSARNANDTSGTGTMANSPASENNASGEAFASGGRSGQPGRPGQYGGLPMDPRIGSIANNLVTSPFIAQRPPLAQSEQQRSQEEEDRKRALDAQGRPLAEGQERGPDGAPAWFTKAREKAEKNKERKERIDGDHEVVRSRFADIPLPRDQRKQGGQGGEQSSQVAEASTPKPTSPNNASAGSAPRDSRASDFAPTSSSSVPASSNAASASSSSASSSSVSSASASSGSASVPVPAPSDSALEKTGELKPLRSPLTPQTDLTGFDRQAFRVLPSEDGSTKPLVVPASEDTPSRTFSPAPTPEATSASTSSTPAAPTPVDSSATQRNRLRDLPSVSGAIPMHQAALDATPIATESLFSDDNSPVSTTGAFVPLGATGTMKPIGEELLAYHNEEEIFIADADDSSLVEEYSETGSYTQTEVVNIPQSRVKSFFGSMGDRFSGRHKEKLESAPSAWLGVDEDFDARKKGDEIGSWDNFNDEDDDDAGWRGGAYGGMSFGENADALKQAGAELLDKEVWLVALGAHESAEAGVKHLLATYPTELRSALFINVMGVGIGDLCMTNSEGTLRTVGVDHRLQGLLAEAGQTLGIQLGQIDFHIFATDATEILASGGRAISLIGLKKNTPVGWRWSDDEAARLSEDNLQDATDLVIEAIKGA
ncbi:MAG: hypothetical protein LBI64_07000 [Coriobacteriales bacterium]|jgi:hypothetical protein|nr:hypothetical protein [Coriobacteriales bacterium]